MPVDDLPPGAWTHLLIGDQWPKSSSLQWISANTQSRKQGSVSFSRYADLLLEAEGRHLASQQGVTADDARGQFQLGADHSDQIAQRNTAKYEAYRNVRENVNDLRNELRFLAEKGNAEIEAINSSQKTRAAKIAEILMVVTRAKEEAYLQTASCIGHVSDQVRAVLNAQGLDTSPQAFAAEQGVGRITRPAPATDAFKAEIGEKLDRLNGNLGVMILPGNGAMGNSEPALGDQGVQAPKHDAVAGLQPAIQANIPDQGAYPSDSRRPVSLEPAHQSGLSSSANVQEQRLQTPLPDQGAMGGVSASGSAPARLNLPSEAASESSALRRPLPEVKVNAVAVEPANSPTSLTPTSLASMTLPSADNPEVPTIASAPNTGTSPGEPQSISAPAHHDVAETFNSGKHAGAPLSNGAEAISALTASQVHIAPGLSSLPVEPIAPAVPVLETANTAPPRVPEIAHPSPAMPEVSHAVLAPAPAAAVPATGPPVSIGPTAVPAATPPGSLIAYGADLRAPAATATAIPTAMPAAPASAPMNPAGGVGPTSQPTVVRQPTSSASPLTATPGLTERALATTAAGAAIGATGASKVAAQLLSGLLAAVARQQPQLCWAIGDLGDGGTILVTDLAGGWIPPGIDIPTGVRIPQPGVGRRSLTALLGATTRTATYEPGQYLPPADAPVATSIRARDTAAVDDLGWELARATKWRDGLPRLAHTLAKAVSAKTGCVDSEITLLRGHLAAVTRSVLATYPANTDPAEVGNWQLLATIDALINDERTLANYHFTWFRAQVRPAEGHR